MGSDLYFGLRALHRNPGFTSWAVAILAVTMAATCLVYSVAYAVLFRALPYERQDQLYHVFWGPRGGQASRGPSVPDFLDWRTRNSVFEDMALTSNGQLVLKLGEYPESVGVTWATTNLFRLLGVQPILGRAFSTEEGEAGRSCQVAMLGYDYWQERFHGDPSVLGRVLSLGDCRPAVVGVLPSDFKFNYPEAVKIWLPLSEDPRLPRSVSSGLVTARMKPGMTPAQAEASMQAVLAALAREYPATNRDRLAARVIPVLGWTAGRFRTVLLTLVGAVVFLLLIGCVNVANLLLARLTDRERETSLRAALGATRWRIVRELLAESLLISLTAGIVGLLLAWLGMDFLRSLLPPELPRGDEVGVNLHVVAFALGLSVATTLAFGLIPALSRSRVNLSESLTGSPSSTETQRGRGLLARLVAAEAMLSLVLLSGAGLMMNSLIRLTHVNLGIDPKNVLAAHTPPVARRHGLTLASRRVWLETTMAAVRGIPGVRQVGAVLPLPLLGGEAFIDIRLGPGMTPSRVRLKIVSGDYFEVMRIPLLSGRLLSARDVDRTERVAVISDSLARSLESDGKSVGRKLYLGNSEASIVGVVADVRNRLPFPPEPEVYLPAAQVEVEPTVIVARYEHRGGAHVSGAVQAALHKLDANAVVEVYSLEDVIAAQSSQLRFLTILLGGAGLLGLILSASGVYSVVDYTVRRRRHELGIRMALGAMPPQLLRRVLRESSTMVAVGMVLGIPIVLGLSIVLRSLVFEVSPADPFTLAIVIAVLAGVSVIASWIPARKVLSMDPAATLRHQ